MKYTLDLDQLLAEGKITVEEHARLRAYAAHATGSLVFNLLIGFGVIAVGGGSLALIPAPETATVLGLAALGAGLGMLLRQADEWRLLANICLLVGALLTGGGVVAFGDASLASFLTVLALLTVTAVVARSSLPAVLAVFALSACLEVGTAYGHATYVIFVEKPFLTVVVFTPLAIGLYQLSKRVALAYEGVTIAAARTSVLIANIGFWVGSLRGDWLWTKREPRSLPPIPDVAFALAWAVALVIAAIWAWRRNRRWVVNTVAVFGGIHFYTQWFERLGTSPETVLAGGVLALGFAVGLRVLNLRMQALNPSA